MSTHRKMTYVAERVTERKPYTDKPPLSLPSKAEQDKVCNEHISKVVGPW